MGYLFWFGVLTVNIQQIINKNKMKKIVTFFAMAAFVVALTSCGNKSTEATEGTEADSMSTMESAPVADTTTTMAVDTTSAMSADTTAAH